MDSKIWGPSAWFFLHTLTFNYPENPTEQDKEIYKNFFLSLQNILPCSKCREHYKELLNDYDISNHLESKNKLIRCLYEIHSRVNLDSNSEMISYNLFKQRYIRKYNISL